MEWAGKQFKIKEMGDWYKIKAKVKKLAVTKVTVRISKILEVEVCY